MILKTGEPKKGGDGVGSDSRAGCSEGEMHDVEVDSGKVEIDEVGKKARKTSKSKNLSKTQKTVGLDFLTPGAKLAFTELRQAFLKASILHHFDPDHHIRIEMNVSGYAIGRVLSQLTSDDSG